MDAVGLYISVPFCRAKCSFCNFASDAFAPLRLPHYVDRLCAEIRDARNLAARIPAHLPLDADTLYLGGGTPSLLPPADLERIFSSLHDHFRLSPDAEITVECAPGQISDGTLEELVGQGVNRLSFGVQSFIDRESAAIGRTHTAAQCVHELDRVRAAGIANLSLDLIAGLPHQTEASWRSSVEQAIATGVPHLSIYLLEVDDESRLGREILTGGARYAAPAVPTDDQAASFYEIACDLLHAAGIAQYEISNFARPGFASAHNRKYWARQPYLGLGLDAHSMLHTTSGSVRFANPDDLDTYLANPLAPPHARPAATDSAEAAPFPLLAPPPPEVAQTPSIASRTPSIEPTTPSSAFVTPSIEPITPGQALEETLFLGLRTNLGLHLAALEHTFGVAALNQLRPAFDEARAAGLLLEQAGHLSLTARGRILSNEVFSLLLLPGVASI